jgi:hypothetical protein
MEQKLTIDQARINSVVGQRNNALNTQAELEAMLAVMSVELEEAKKELVELKAKLDDI